MGTAGHHWAMEGPWVGRQKVDFNERLLVRSGLGLAFDYRHIFLCELHVGAHYTNSPVLVRLAGIEPTTLGFGGQYSIH